MITFAVRSVAVLVLGAGVPPILAAQHWDAPDALALLERAIARRQAAFADTALRDWSARAHGFVFFLGQIGEGLAEPPRLIKSDQLELEVYWRAPSQSKQRIVGWRDRRDLPTDINYHRDHLGIVMNNFPDLIRLGEGDEVRDVPHPVSPAGLAAYQFGLGDSLTIRLPARAIQVVEVRFRPRDFRAARIVGSAFVEIATADLVRLSFGFTRAAYRDDQLEDITVSVENSLWEGRWWLPLRQEIEIRRRATFLEFPARGIIRGRFEIDEYRFNQDLDPALFRPGPEIAVLPRAALDSFVWPDSLGAAIRDVARPARLADFDAVREEATRLAMGHVLTGLRQTQLAGVAISDFVHVNRVEGVAFGAGLVLRSADQARQLRVFVGVATDTTLPTGGARLSLRRGATTWRLAAAREVRDIGDTPVIARLLNSILAQEAGADYGDYYLAAGASAGFSHTLGGRSDVAVEALWQRVDSLGTAARWARGAYDRPNPGVDAGEWSALRIAWKRQAGSFATSRDLTGRLEVEAAAGASAYARASGELRGQVPAGPTTVLLRAGGGLATRDLPRHRAFVLGGRGTLLGEPFRSLAGRRAAWTHVEWQLPVRVPQLTLGSFAGTGRRLTLAPWAALGWTDGALAGFPGRPARGLHPSIGLGVGWLHDLIRLDLGYGARSRRWAAAVDVSRDFWGIL